jgi:hypothetical protein
LANRNLEVTSNLQLKPTGLERQHRFNVYVTTKPLVIVKVLVWIIFSRN